MTALLVWSLAGFLWVVLRPEYEPKRALRQYMMAGPIIWVTVAWLERRGQWKQ